MSCVQGPVCNDNSRRTAIREGGPPPNGIDTVEVLPKAEGDPLTQRELAVFFFHGIPAGLDNSNLGAYEFTGGQRVPGPSLRVEDVQADAAGFLRLRLNQAGDFSDYALKITHPGLDPLFSCRTFNFKVSCPNPFDCAEPPALPPAPPPGPPIDYQTKDYRSFRRALLEFLPQRLDAETESNEADLGVTLAELFSYAGDMLSYYQDRVAGEAYLGAARERASVRRHARLVDYRMHDGAAARTVVHFNVTNPVTVPAGFALATDDEDPRRRLIFETEEPCGAIQEWNGRRLHTWGNTRCCLPAGTTFADLAGDWTAVLHTGQLLLIEEVLGPSRQPDDTTVLKAEAADPSRRQVVRVTAVNLLHDPLPAPAGTQVTRVAFAADPLRCEFCLESDSAGNPATLVRGNLARAGQGRTIAAEPVRLAAGVVVAEALQEGPLTWLDPPYGVALVPPETPDPRRARSSIRLTVNGDLWEERESLLDSGPASRHFVVEVDEEGRARIRFGDGQLGVRPQPGDTILATYRVGNGPAGNVGVDRITRAGAGSLPAGVTAVRNPVPASGGTAPEAIESVRRDAPQAFQRAQFRAVTLDDYARTAEEVAGVSAAGAEFRWTGSWMTVFNYVDPEGRADLKPEVEQAVRSLLDIRRQAGYDMNLRPPVYVPLDIELVICVQPDYFAADVLRAVADALTSGYRRDGQKGFFHPDQFTFNQGLALSKLCEAVHRLAGVRSVIPKTFQRLNRPSYGELEAGFIDAGPFEVLRLDNNRSLPGNGRLVLTTGGGK